jgi:beta-lactamase class A
MQVKYYDIHEGGASRFRESLVVTLLLALLFSGIISVPVLASRAVQRQSIQPAVVQEAPKVAPEPVQPIEPTPTVVSPQIVDLQPILDNWAKQNPSQQWGIAVKSLSGVEFQAQLNADKHFRSASIYKLFLLQSLFNRYSLAQQQTTSVNLGSSNRSLAACVDLMLRISDNACGEAVAQKLGWTKVTKELKAAGYLNTDLSKGDAPVTSAGDTARYLEQLNGTMLDEPSKATVMKSLLAQKWNKGIPAGCANCTVANKTGTLGSIMNDAAIVQYKGGSYVLVVMSEGGSFKQIADLTKQIQIAINAAQL